MGVVRSNNRIDGYFRPEFFALFLMFSPVVDVITGAMLLSGRGIGISSLYKGVLVFLCIFRLMLGMSRGGWIWTTLFGGTIILNLTNVYFESGIKGVLYDGNILLKLITPICLIGVFAHMRSRDYRRVRCWTYRIIQFYRVFFPLSLIIPKLLGVGYRTYSYGVGYKGFYYAGNDISIVMVVIAIWNIRELMKHPKKKDIFLSILSLVALLLLGTKTAWLMAAFIVGYFVLRSRRLLWKILAGLGTVIGAAGFFAIERGEIQNLIGSLRSLYSRYIAGGGTVLTFFLSGRDQLISMFFQKTYEENMVWSFLFGKGSFLQASWFPRDQLIEMDLLDLLIRCGITGSLLIVGFYGYWFKKCYKKADYSQRLVWYVMAAFSMIAGHVLFSPLANLVLVVVYLDMMCAEDKPRAENVSNSEKNSVRRMNDTRREKELGYRESAAVSAYRQR